MSELKQATEVDIAYHILKSAGQPIYFRTLIEQALEIKDKPIHSIAQAISEVHTQINLDSRFAYASKGMWGLADWTPQNTRKAASEDADAAVPVPKRRERLLEEIQQDYVAAGTEPGEVE